MVRTHRIGKHLARHAGNGHLPRGEDVDEHELVGIGERVGEIVDETDLEDAEVVHISANEWRVQGSLPCEDAAKLGWPVEESDDYDTLAGWLLAAMDYVPQLGDVYEQSGYRFVVRRMRRRRISIVGVVRLKEPAPAEEDAKE